MPASRRYLQALEQLLLADAVLRSGERADRRTDVRAFRQRAQGIDGNVLPVEREHLGLAREPRERLCIGEVTADLRRNLACGRLACRIEEQEIETERIARQSEHAAQLAGADDADGHAFFPMALASAGRGSAGRPRSAACETLR